LREIGDGGFSAVVDLGQFDWWNLSEKQNDLGTENRE